MIDNFDDCLDFVLKWEGGYTDDTRDPGGITNLGITKATWQSWTGHAVTAQEMKDLTVDKVKPLYQQRYWNAVKAFAMPSGVDLCLFDSAVNQGPSTAIMTLQKVLGTFVDAHIGPATMELVSMNSPSSIIHDFCEERRKRYTQTKNFNIYGKGWLRRLDACQTTALAMID
jgi:lysozyme family protein